MSRDAGTRAGSGLSRRWRELCAEERTKRKGKERLREGKGKERKGQGKAGRTVARSEATWPRMQAFVSVRRPRVECKA